MRARFIEEKIYRLGASDISGTGCFATRDLPSGSVMDRGLTRVNDTGNSDADLCGHEMCAHANHSNDPNVTVERDGDDRVFRSARPIAVRIDVTIGIPAIRTMEFGEGEARLLDGNREVCSLGYELNPPDEWFDEPYASVHDLWTSPSERGRGLATELMRACMGRFRSMGACAVTLIVGRENAPALGLYRKLGFRTFRGYEQELCLWLPLGGNE